MLDYDNDVRYSRDSYGVPGSPELEALTELLDNKAWPVDIVSGILMDVAATNL